MPFARPDQEVIDLPPVQASPPNFLYVVWRRKSLIFLGFFVGLAVGALYFSQATPTYQSNSLVMVIKKSNNPMPTTTGGDPRVSYYEDYLSTHTVLIRSPLIVRRAVAKKEVQNLKMFEGMSDPTGAVIGSLIVNRDSSSSMPTNILNMAYKGTVPEDCGVVLNAVIESYKEFLDETYKNVSNETLARLTSMTDTLQKSLQEKEKAYADFQEKNNIYGKGALGDPQEDWLTQLVSRRFSLTLRRGELQKRLSELETAIKEGKDQATLLGLIAAMPGKAGSDTDEKLMEKEMFALLKQEQGLLEVFGPDHPQVVALRKVMNMTREFYGQTGFAKTGLISGKERTSGQRDPVKVYLESMKRELAETEVSLRVVNDLVEAEQTEVRKYGKIKAIDRQFREDIESTRHKLFDPIITRLNEIKLVQDLGGYDARVISPAGIGYKVAPLAIQIFMAAAALGLLGGIGLAYLADLCDKSFRTPDEIRRQLDLPVIGHIPYINIEDDATVKSSNGDAAAMDPHLVGFYHPKSVQAEAYRGLRTSLYFSTQGQVHQVIQVTSPNSRDGKSTLTSNLGVAIAQSGKKVVLVDADFRKPRLHKVFGISPKTGLASVIGNEAELKNVIHPTQIPGLSLIPCGRRPSNPAELLTSPRFKELLDVLREQFEFVLIDTPPLLAVSDPSAVAPRVDGVIMVLRLSRNGRPNAERARDMLRHIGANVLGVVVNGVGRGPGSSSYDYNRYYTYYYNYNDYDYSYHRRDDSSSYYYHKEAEAEETAEATQTANGKTASPVSETGVPADPASQAQAAPQAPAGTEQLPAAPESTAPGGQPPAESELDRHSHRSRSQSHAHGHSRKGFFGRLFGWWK